MRKCIIIPDSFKGSLDSIEICSIAAEKVQKIFPDCETVTLPVADGGEGTVSCFLHAMDGELVNLIVKGPYMDSVNGFYGRFDDLAVVEMAAAASLPMVENHMDPSKTTTYGVGELILHAVEHGAKRVILGMGGSCTNDGGCGCAAALGVKFLDRQGNEFIPVGGTLDRISCIDISGAKKLLQGVELTAMCDVENPMYGPTGAAYVFGPQKGADKTMVQELDRQLEALDVVIQSSLKIPSVALLPGSGAAGALGAGVVAFLGAKLRSGIETVLDVLHFDEKIQDADAVFTGEGRIDGQSLRGKAVIGVSKRAVKQGVPVYAIVGDVEDDAMEAYNMGVTAIFSINRMAVPFSIAKTRSRQDFSTAFEDILRLIRAVEQRKSCRNS